MVKRRLIRDADRGLEGVEAPALDRVARRRAVSAVADVARLSPLAGPLQGLDDVTLAQLSLGAAVELDQVDVVGPEAAQTPLDALDQRARPPVRAPVLRGMTALREEVVLRAPPADGPADQGFAPRVALGRVDGVQPRIEGAPEQPADPRRRDACVADLGSAEAEHAHLHVGLTESPSLHGSAPRARSAAPK